jgi:acetyltransferase-like isoleucine patch superfamily enzyme
MEQKIPRLSIAKAAETAAPRVEIRVDFNSAKNGMRNMLRALHRVGSNPNVRELTVRLPNSALDGLPSLAFARHTNPDGTLGGFVESPESVNIGRNVYIAQTASIIAGSGYIDGNVRLNDGSSLSGNFEIYGNIEMSGNVAIGLNTESAVRLTGNMKLVGNVSIDADSAANVSLRSAFTHEARH